MNESILHRIAINRSGQPLKQFQKQEKFNQMLDAGKMEQALGAQLEATDKYQLETIPRKTVLKLVSCDIDVHYIFRVQKGEAENYMGAMRQVLSRTRRKAKRKKMRLDEFKMLHIGTDETDPNFDTITLVRSKTLSAHEESVLDELMDALKKD